jgi:hypothetical protein
MDQAFCFARDNAGKSRLASMAMMAMTTNNSINVKARCVYTIILDAGQEHLLQFGFGEIEFVSHLLSFALALAGSDPQRGELRQARQTHGQEPLTSP